MLVALATAALSPSLARASHSQETIFDATSTVLNAPTVAKQGEILDKLKNLGVDQVRLVVPWKFLAPARGKSSPPNGFDASNPRDYPRALYTGLDNAVLGIEERGMTTLLTPAGPAPVWGTDANRGSGAVNPTPIDFGRFVRALGSRYDGTFRAVTGKDATPVLPRITHWSVWNEPNQQIFLRPQYKNGRAYSPVLYRFLYLAAHQGLVASGHGRDTILLGETAPSGGRTGVDPIPFMKGALCLDANYRRRGGCKPIQASGWAHHPYSPGTAPFLRSANPGLISMANLSILTRALGRAASGRGTSGRLPIFLTEYGIQSIPDRRFGVGLAGQMGYLAISEYLAWRTPGVRSYAQYLLNDDEPGNPYRFTTGLAFHSGRPKPSMRSFPITLLAKQTGSRVLIWGHVRPGNGRQLVTVTYRQGGKAHTLRRLKTNSRGYFQFGSPFRAGRTWAAGARVSGVGTLQGPYQRAFKF